MNNNDSEDYLKTLQDSGRPPESRIATATQARSIYERMWQADVLRAKKRQLVKGLVDGNPPYRQADLTAAGRDNQANINWRIAESYFNNAVGAFYDLFSEAPTYATIKLKGENPEETERWSRDVTTHFDWLCRYEPSFDYNMQVSEDQMVLYCCGPLVFQDDLDWRPTAIECGRLKVPERAKSNTEYWELASVEVDYLPHELYERILYPKEATEMGWNVERTRQAIMNAHPDYQQGGLWKNWEWHQQQLKNGSLYYSAMSQTIRCVHLFFREFCKPGEKEGRVTQVTILVESTDQMGADKFLFQKIGRYENWNQCIHPMYYDRGGGGFHHSVTGMGVKMYSAIEYQNRLLCNLANKAFSPKMVFKPTTATQAEAFSLQQFDEYAVLCLDSETEILTSQGWVGMGKMTYEHNVANWDNGKVFFEPPKFIIERDRLPNERMVILETCHHSMRVTEDHRLLYRTNPTGKFKVKNAGGLVGKSGYLPVSGTADVFEVVMPEVTLPKNSGRTRLAANKYALRKATGMSSDDAAKEAWRRIEERDSLRYAHPSELTREQCELIGFWIGDGSRCRLQSGGVEYTICQSTSCPSICNRVDQLLSACNIDFKKRTGKTKLQQDFYIWAMPRGTGFGPQKRRGVFSIEPYLDKHGSRLLWGLNDEQFTALISGLWMADGSHNDNTSPKNTIGAVGISQPLFDLLQAIACVRGYRASITRQTKTRQPHYTPLLRISFTKRESHRMSRGFYPVFETGWKPERVWCVTSTTGNIITRRRGFVTVTGNSEGFDLLQTPIQGVMEEGLVFNRELSNQISSNLSQYRSQQKNQKGNPKTAYEVGIDAQHEASLQKTQMNRWYVQMDLLYAEMYRRATLEGSGKYGAGSARCKEFLKRCYDSGVPREAMKKVEFVKASRVVGQGSEFLRKQTLNEIWLTVGPGLPETGRTKLVNDMIAAGAGQAAVDRYNPQADASQLPDDQTAIAFGQVADMKIGVPAVVTATQNPAIFATIFIQAADQAAGSLEQGANPKEVAAFLDLAGQAIAQHIQRMAGDPSRKQLVAQLTEKWEQLAKLQDQLVEQISSQAEEEQQRQAQMQQQQREMMGEMALERMKVEGDLALKARKTDASIQDKQLKTRQSMILKDATTAQNIRLTEQKHRANRKSKEG